MKALDEMTNSQLREEIRQAVEIVLQKPLDTINPNQTFVGDLGLDSLGIMKMALELENRLKIVIEEGAEFEIQTVADLVEFLKAKLIDNDSSI